MVPSCRSSPSLAANAPKVVLSARQRDCLRLAARGLTSSQIAAQLGLSPRTIDEHIALACRQLGVRTRIQAVARLARAAIHNQRAPQRVWDGSD